MSECGLRQFCKRAGGFFLVLLFSLVTVGVAEDWPQLKLDGRRSGDASDRSLRTPLGLVAAVPLSDAVFTSPAVVDGRVFVVDGSGVAWCFRAETLEPLWRTETSRSPTNCNNVSSPAVVDGFVHFGTTAGQYWVLDARTGRPVSRHSFDGDPILSAPVVHAGRVYCATLGGRVFCVEPNGRLRWVWDYAREELGFTGDRWSAADWFRWKQGRVTWRDQFCCPWDVAAFGELVVVPVGGRLICLKDNGDRAVVVRRLDIPSLKGSEKPGLFGVSVDRRGRVYYQWHRRDNTSRVDVLPLQPEAGPAGYVAGTFTRNDLPGSVGFASVSFRGDEVFRCRPEEGFGLCRHRVCEGKTKTEPPTEVLSSAAGLASPVVTKDHVVYGTLDGRLVVVPLKGGQPWSFQTPFGKALTAPVAVADGHVYFGCEDGYLYALGPKGRATPPTRDLQLWKIRTPLQGPLAAPRYDWFTNFGDLQNRNFTPHGVEPPLRVAWVRRFAGTYKHLPVCGGGRLYTHTAEGQVFAVEQTTGRLLWRRFFPGVHISYTAPIYWQERLLVPQAGLKGSWLRCFDAATGRLLWQAPFTGSPSWSRQQPPVIHNGLVFYMFSTGRYAPLGTGIFVFRGRGPEAKSPDEEVASWLYSHDNPYYPRDQRPIVCAWDLRTGREVWRRDFSEYGHGGDDAGLVVVDGVLYYSCFFGYSARRRGQPGPHGLTAALDPQTGRVLWLTTKHSVTAGATLSAEKGRLYLGGYNAWDSKQGPRHVWCLDTRDGSLIWKSDPLTKAINVVTVGSDFVFAFAYGGNGYLLDKQTGRVRTRFNHRHACTRFSLAGRYLIGPNGDLLDTTDQCRVVSSGPPIDARECVGGVVSNGRLYYTSQATGLQMCLVGQPTR